MLHNNSKTQTKCKLSKRKARKYITVYKEIHSQKSFLISIDCLKLSHNLSKVDTIFKGAHT